MARPSARNEVVYELTVADFESSVHEHITD